MRREGLRRIGLQWDGMGLESLTFRDAFRLMLLFYLLNLDAIVTGSLKWAGLGSTFK